MATQQVQQGWSQMTAAAQQIIRSGLGSIARKTGSRRRSKSSSPARARKSKRRGSGSKKRATSSRKSSRPARLVKGSKAAKAYMAKIRKLRK